MLHSNNSKENMLIGNVRDAGWLNAKARRLTDWSGHQDKT